jgi:TolA-binding protein
VSKVSSTSGAANRSQASEQEQLAREVAILDAARLALGRSDYDAAARLSASYLTQYPSGRLEPEARYMKMQAEVHGGRLDRARHEARRLLELDPEGPHAEAARGVNLLH